MKTSMTLSLGLSLILITTACGPGYKAPSSESFQSAKSDCGASCGSTTAPASDPWQKVDMAEIESSANPLGTGTVKIIGVDKVNNLLVVNIPLPTMLFGGVGGMIQIPQLPGAFVGIDNTGARSVIALKIPLSYIVRGIQTADPGGLPNGNPLPGIPDGELPRLGIELTKGGHEAYLYLGKGAFAVFIPTPSFKYSSYIPSLTYPIKTKSQRKIGFIAYVAEQGMYPGGAYLSFAFPSAIQRLLDSIIP